MVSQIILSYIKRVMYWNKTSDKKLSIRHHLVGLVLVAVIPVVLFAAGLVGYLSKERSKTLEVNLLGTTKALNAAVDEQMIAMRSSLNMLSEVEDFMPSRIQYLHTRLRHFVKSHPAWDSITFADTSGVQIFNTAKRYGIRLPRLKNEEFFRKMLLTKKTVISGFRLNTITKKSVVSVAAPVLRNGHIIYVLIASLDLNSFARLFGASNIPKEWGATILDEKGHILASSEKELNIGSLASEELAEKIKLEGSNIFYEKSVNEKHVLGSSSRSKLTNWTIVLALPDDGNLITYKKTIFLIMIGGGLLLLCIILFALYLGRRISAPILAISQSAKALGQGKSLGDLSTSLSEAHDVNQALKLAAEQRGLNEEKIRTLYDQAQEAVNIRDTFMSVASHELKTPLTTLNLQFQMLNRLMKRKEVLSRDELSKPFVRIQDQVKRLVMLVDDLLDVSRISSGKMDYHSETFDLMMFLEEVVQQFEDETHKKGCPIALNGPASLLGNWDKHRLEQVLVNLITNGIKYGNGKPIEINVVEQSDSVVMEVKDQGLGIAEDDLPKVFQKFERLGDRKKASGLGLGLWIVRKIVEGLEGSICVTSKLGVGSTFRLELPLKEVKERSSEILTLNIEQKSNHQELLLP
jgi:signal transduction histidine kinase